MKIPPEFIRFIQQASESQVDEVLIRLKIKFPNKPITQSSRDYIVGLCNNPSKGKSVISSIYDTKMQITFGVLGSIPGPIGWVANVIDVIFCLLLGDMVGAVISGVSIAFPCFKAGKTAAIAVKPLLKMIEPKLMYKAFDAILKRMKQMHLPLDETIEQLRKQLRDDFIVFGQKSDRATVQTYTPKILDEGNKMPRGVYSETKITPRTGKIHYGINPYSIWHKKL